MASLSFTSASVPVEPGSADELRRFEQIQERLKPLARKVLSNQRSPQTVVVIPSLTLDVEELAKIPGSHHYEERMLCMLMLLRLPRTRVVYVTSQQVPNAIVDYYLHLLPGVPLRHARSRLTLLSCHDASDLPLTHKILDRPRLVERIRSAIADPGAAHITCFNSTALERSLSVRLGIPLYGNDPKLNYLGTKSGSRELFREAGVPLPDGFERLRDAGDIAEALTDLKRKKPGLRRAAVKLDEGFSGEGNAVFAFDGAPGGRDLHTWVRDELPYRMKFEAESETWERYRTKFEEMGGIVECWMEGEVVRSPSVQCRINPLGDATVVSTHDQVLGGPSGQIFLGSTFPADSEYSRDIKEAGERVGEVLEKRGALGRFAIDFISVRRGDGSAWEHAAIEINLRKGGTTHPYLILRFLTDGRYDPDDGLYCTPTAKPCYYYASDNLSSPAYRGLTPDDLVDIAVDNGLHFDGASQQGVVFHLIGALSQYGKVGTVCISDSHQNALNLYRDTVAVLDRETGN